MAEPEGYSAADTERWIGNRPVLLPLALQRDRARVRIPRRCAGSAPRPKWSPGGGRFCPNPADPLSRWPRWVVRWAVRWAVAVWWTPLVWRTASGTRRGQRKGVDSARPASGLRGQRPNPAPAHPAGDKTCRRWRLRRTHLTRASLDAAIKYPWAGGGPVRNGKPTAKFGVYDDAEVFRWVEERHRAPGAIEGQVMISPTTPTRYMMWKTHQSPASSNWAGSAARPNGQGYRDTRTWYLPATDRAHRRGPATVGEADWCLTRTAPGRTWRR